MIVGFILTIFLVALNGCFVAAEFAIVKVRTSQLELETKPGTRLRKITDHITKHLEDYLAATQLGITIASIALGVIAEDAMHQAFSEVMKMIGINPHTQITHAISATISFTFITALHVIFGEMIPKNLGIRNPLGITLFLAVPLRICYILFSPFVSIANGLANWVLLRFGITPNEHGHEVHSMDELELIIDHSVKAEQESLENKTKQDLKKSSESEEESTEDELNKNKMTIIQRVLKFDDIEVRKAAIGKDRVFMLNVDMSLNKIVDKVIAEGYSRIPVYKENEDNIIGMLYSKDLMRIWQEHQKYPDEEVNIRKILKKPYYIKENLKLGDVLQRFQQKAIQFAIVIDENKKFKGILSMEDILEEFLGEIYDEYDALQDILMPTGENEFIANGLARLSNLNEMLPERLPEDVDYDTLSGLIIHQCGKIPSIVETVKIGNFEINVVKHNKRRIQTATIKWINQCELK
jgi:CBS domain containing-hemolysin-like protein